MKYLTLVLLEIKTKQILKCRLSKSGYFQVSIKINIENKFINRLLFKANKKLLMVIFGNI